MGLIVSVPDHCLSFYFIMGKWCLHASSFIFERIIIRCAFVAGKNGGCHFLCSVLLNAVSAVLKMFQ